MVGGQSVSSASKMSVNTTSGKMVPGMPPGVASVLPAQYMIGANAAAAGEIGGEYGGVERGGAGLILSML